MDFIEIGGKEEEEEKKEKNGAKIRFFSFSWTLAKMTFASHLPTPPLFLLDTHKRKYASFMSLLFFPWIWLTLQFPKKVRQLCA